MSKKREVKPIGDILAAILKLGINFSEAQLKKRVNEPNLLDGVMLAFPFSKQVIDVLNDDDSDNIGQVREILFDHVNGPVADFLDRLLYEKISAVNDPNLKVILGFSKDQAIDALRIVSDDNDDNNVQLEKFWEQILQDGEFIDIIKFNVIVPLLKKAKADDNTIEFVLTVFTAAVDGLLKEKSGEISQKIEKLQ